MSGVGGFHVFAVLGQAEEGRRRVGGWTVWADAAFFGFGG